MMRTSMIVLVSTVVVGGCTTPRSAFRRVDEMSERRADLETVRRPPETLDELHPAVAERLAQPLDADAAVSVALRQSPELQARLAMVDIAVAELWSARPPNPEVELETLLVDGQSAVLEMAAVIDLGAMVPTGSTRWVELVANNPGDWAMHCHMTHHIMNQMGHGAPNMVGVGDRRDFDRRLRRLVPGYMPMGRNGMAAMGEHDMPHPGNSIPMRGGPGAFGRIDMGGMFTIFKVRATLDDYADPGWYEHPEGTVARRATEEELRADGIPIDG